ncbi:MAG: ribonuclease VapC2 [Candidatus Bathyarchaeota archaeon B63]|nr:MAG: ribonuclease VapC2 [Candidatus Bathyarchaeota archaeon B63]
MRRRRAIILDTTAFIAGFNIPSSNDEVYSVPEVEEELKKSPMARLRLRAAIRDGRLRLREPGSCALRRAVEASREMGDHASLSDVDMRILALAVQLREEGYDPTILTDDFSIQNVAKRLALNYEPLTTHGIKYQLRWTLYCPACRRRYPPDYGFETCIVCGTRLKRKPMSRSRA